MIDTILVATDGSEGGSTAEKAGVHLAARLRVRLSGVTVVEDGDVQPPPDSGLALPPYPEAELSAYFHARSQGLASRFADRARAEGIEATCDVGRGRADDRIVEKAQDSELLVIGRDGCRANQSRALVGSVTESVIRKLSKSSIVIPSGSSLSGPIVVAFDGSSGSRVAAAKAIELSNSLGETIHVFVDSKDKGRAVARFEEVRELLAGVQQPLRETSSTLGRPDVKLVDTATEIRAGMIVMGAYGRNRKTDFFLGSNAAAVVRTSPVPVLLAR
ncbi:MAG: hypothetical protein CL917_02245 [Deltaproteobacteria bacterium]|nr:hypothetical protein [Deltaproteobacteria bacterium]